MCGTEGDESSWQNIVQNVNWYGSITYLQDLDYELPATEYYSHVLGVFVFTNAGLHLFLAATTQLYEWFSPSVCLSVCPSITPFRRHRIIMKFSGAITSDIHAKGQGQGSKVKVTEVNTQLSHFRTVTPVWIQIWWWNDAQSLMLLRRGAPLFFKVIRKISRSQEAKNRQIWPNLSVSGLQLKSKSTNGYGMMRKAWIGIEEVTYCF